VVWSDAPSGKLSADARLALDNMWALQLKSGEMSGSWAWLQFHNAPWEGDSQYYGTALAAITVSVPVLVISVVAAFPDRTSGFALQIEAPIDSNGDSSDALIRLSAGGSTLDSSFGSNGVLQLMNGQPVTLDGQGRILAVQGSRIVRYDPTGHLDQTYGSGGSSPATVRSGVVPRPYNE